MRVCGLWNQPSYRKEVIEPPVEPPAPPPTVPAPVTVAFEVTNSWPGNISGKITIHNISATAINGWTLEFDLPVTLAAGNLWGATLESASETRYRLRHASWTAAVPAGGSVSFTFNAAGLPTAELKSVLFNGLAVE